MNLSTGGISHKTSSLMPTFLSHTQKSFVIHATRLCHNHDGHLPPLQDRSSTPALHHHSTTIKHVSKLPYSLVYTATMQILVHDCCTHHGHHPRDISTADAIYHWHCQIVRGSRNCTFWVFETSNLPGTFTTDISLSPASMYYESHLRTPFSVRPSPANTRSLIMVPPSDGFPASCLHPIVPTLPLVAMV
ncbi:hypothetical protein ARMGADRAFT_791263 [Armillaria gallica]|uniref:Uncharacterized protein n=1 Tax=Armillaria gallica TaxID=47427 RepID=A0A2H3DMY8_ARMGA|nr:hypothetical protein ARMGADRAFT_791263 [Armillaria gallica]